MTIRSVAALVLGIASTAFAGQPQPAGGAAPAASAKATEVNESRSRQLVKSETRFGLSSELRITLHIEGDAVKDATKYGKINITQAVDDLGTDLKRKEESLGLGGEDGFGEIRKPMSFGSGNKEAPKGFDIDLQLKMPARKAAKLRMVKGDFQVLAGGEKKTVTLTKLKSQMGKTIADPALKAAGLTVTVKDPKAAGFGGEGGNSLVLEVKGPRSVIQETEIVDSAGQKVSSGYSAMGSDDTQTTSYSLDKPLDDTIAVKMQMVLGQKTVTVPFELKDVELP